MDPVPMLLPKSAIPPQHPGSWRPTKHLKPPEPPIQDDSKLQEMETAAIRQGLDSKPFKRVKPRRTVDYMGGIGRWNMLKKLRPNPRYIPYMRPAPPYIIDLLPPAAYPTNLSTSLCTKFVHTSTNKIRCPVNVVCWTPEGRRVLTGSYSGEFTLWNGLTFNFETILQAHDSAIRAIQFTHSGAFIASADQNGLIKYFQPNMNNLKQFQAHREAIRGLSFSPDDERFVSASDDATVRLWNFGDGREERVFTGHNWDVKCVEWHPTKGLLVSGSKDNLVKFWDPRTGTCLSTLHQHKNTIQALSWSPSGDYIASASRDQTVRVFDIRAMKEWRVLKGHRKEVCSLTWHPIHPILVSGGSEGSILHWDMSPTPSASSSITITEPRAALSEAHDSNVWSMAFHPLGHLMVSASNDHTTRFWSRERPGEDSGVAGGRPGERDGDVSHGGDYENDNDNGGEGIVPGFGGGGFGEEVQQQAQQWGPGGMGQVNGYSTQGQRGGRGGWQQSNQPLQPQQLQAAMGGHYTLNPSYEPGSAGGIPGIDGVADEDGIPGFGGAPVIGGADIMSGGGGGYGGYGGAGYGAAPDGAYGQGQNGNGYGQVSDGYDAAGGYGGSYGGARGDGYGAGGYSAQTGGGGGGGRRTRWGPQTGDGTGRY